MTRKLSRFCRLPQKIRKQNYCGLQPIQGSILFEGNQHSRKLKVNFFGITEAIGAEEGTRTPTPLRVHGPEPCASANSATSAREEVQRERLDEQQSLDYFAADCMSNSGTPLATPVIVGAKAPAIDALPAMH